jgi:hypothetical protein
MKRARLPMTQRLANDNAYSKNTVEKLDWSYWDTAVLVSTTLAWSFFAVPIGGTKTKADTNMTSASQIPQGQNFKVHFVKVGLRTNAAINTAGLQAIYTMLYNTTATIKMPGKDSMGEWTLAELLGLEFATVVTPTVAGDTTIQAQPKFTGIFPLNNPLKIGGNGTFSVEVVHHVAPAAALDNCKLKITLNGRLFRGV